MWRLLLLGLVACAPLGDVVVVAASEDPCARCPKTHEGRALSDCKHANTDAETQRALMPGAKWTMVCEYR